MGSEGSLGRELVNSLLLDPSFIVVGFDLGTNSSIVNKNYMYLPGSVNSKSDIASLRKLIEQIQIDHHQIGSMSSIVNCFAHDEYKFKVSEIPDNLPESEWATWGWRHYPHSDFVAQYETNVVGIHQILTGLYEAYADSEECSIVNFSSQYAKRTPNQELFKGFGKFIFKPPGYSASKAAIENYTEYLAKVFQGKGIRVNCIALGSVDLGQSDEFKNKYSKSTLSGRMMSKKEAVNCLQFLISSASAYMNGACLTADGGWSIK